MGGGGGGGRGLCKSACRTLVKMLPFLTLNGNNVLSPFVFSGHSASLTTYDETALCSPTFRILKAMVTEWVKDIFQYRYGFTEMNQKYLSLRTIQVIGLGSSRQVLIGALLCK